MESKKAKQYCQERKLYRKIDYTSFGEKIKIEKVMKGDCFKCSCYDSFQNYCDYYKIMLSGNGYEPTCNNSELKDKIK